MLPFSIIVGWQTRPALITTQAAVDDGIFDGIGVASLAVADPIFGGEFVELNWRTATYGRRYLLGPGWFLKRWGLAGALICQKMTNSSQRQLRRDELWRNEGGWPHIFNGIGVLDGRATRDGGQICVDGHRSGNTEEDSSGIDFPCFHRVIEDEMMLDFGYQDEG